MAIDDAAVDDDGFDGEEELRPSGKAAAAAADPAAADLSAVRVRTCASSRGSKIPLPTCACASTLCLRAAVGDRGLDATPPPLPLGGGRRPLRLLLRDCVARACRWTSGLLLVLSRLSACIRTAPCLSRLFFSSMRDLKASARETRTSKSTPPLTSERKVCIAMKAKAPLRYHVDFPLRH
jgi:hypothetical protein